MRALESAKYAIQDSPEDSTLKGPRQNRKEQQYKDKDHNRGERDGGPLDLEEFVMKYVVNDTDQSAAGVM